MPVDGGIRLPLMTFSFSPISIDLAAVAASREHAASHGQTRPTGNPVASDALVTERVVRAFAGSPPSAMTPCLFLERTCRPTPPAELVPPPFDLDAAQHRRAISRYAYR